jgi:hypothetical protein
MGLYTASVTMPTVVFWVVTSYGFVDGYKLFEVTYKTARGHNPEDNKVAYSSTAVFFCAA